MGLRLALLSAPFALLVNAKSNRAAVIVLVALFVAAVAHRVYGFFRSLFNSIISFQHDVLSFGAGLGFFGLPPRSPLILAASALRSDFDAPPFLPRAAAALESSLVMWFAFKLFDRCRIFKPKVD
jgi:hypothetical protein